MKHWLLKKQKLIEKDKSIKMSDTQEVIDKLYEARNEAGNIDIDEWPAHSQKCQCLIDKALALLQAQPCATCKGSKRKKFPLFYAPLLLLLLLKMFFVGGLKIPKAFLVGLEPLPMGNPYYIGQIRSNPA